MIKKVLALGLATSIPAMALLCTKPKNNNSCPGKYQQNIAYFADEHDPHNRLLVIDYKNMELLDEIPIEGSLNHHADLSGVATNAPYIITIPKGSNFISFYSAKDGRFIKKIRLPFRPRSADAYNKTNDLIFLNSKDRPAGVIIDAKKLQIVGKLGFNIDCNTKKDDIFRNYEIKNLVCSTNDFGGDQISGHPIWLDKSTAAILDRANRYIHVFSIYKKGLFKRSNIYITKRIQSIPTDTSLHQMIAMYPNSLNNRVFFGETESNVAQKKYAGIYKFIKRGHRLKVDKFTYFKYNGKYGVYGHNLFITPDKKYLYAPAGATIDKDGNIGKGGIFVINTKNLNIVKFIETGFGAGHVAFAKNRGLAVVTNHKDDYITVLDWKKHRFIKNVKLPYEHEGIASLNQSHSQYIDKNEEYYYNVWTDGGVFFRLNLDSLEIDDEIFLDGIPIQGNFIPRVTTACNIPKPSPIDGFDLFFGNYKDKISSIKKYIKSSLESNNYDDKNFDKKEFIKNLKNKIKWIKKARRGNIIPNEEYEKYIRYLFKIKREYWKILKGLD